MPPVVTSRFKVRSYEIDSYSHLNNGVYVSWLEQGRLEYLQAHDFSYDDFARRGEWFVVRRTEIDFRSPLHVDERVVLRTAVVGMHGTSVRFRQIMRRIDADGGEAGPAACEALTIMVFTDGRGATPIPDDVRAGLEVAAEPL